MNKKEEFFTARRKALSTYGRYDFALLSDKYYGAKFADTGKVGIKNAFVFVNFTDHHTLEWKESRVVHQILPAYAHVHRKSGR